MIHTLTDALAHLVAYLLCGVVVVGLFIPTTPAKPVPPPPRPKLRKRVPIVDPITESPVATRPNAVRDDRDDDLGLLGPQGGRHVR